MGQRRCRLQQVSTLPVMPKPARPAALVSAHASPRTLLPDLRHLILTAREQVARTVDSTLVALNWEIGRRISQDILAEKRAAYGARIVSTVSRQLEPEFGRGFSEKSLRHMIRFVEVFPDRAIVSTLSRQLAWSHFLEIIYQPDPLARDFYTEMCRVERWSVRTLRQKIQSMLFERTALSRQPAKLIKRELAHLRRSDRLSPNLVFRDPYVLDFLGLKDTYAERDLEAAILREMEYFLLELGVGFSFVARQKRMTIGGRDHYLDLLFYHRGLKRLVALDLKLDNFAPADKAQMELYLAWLRKNEQPAGEAPPIGLILCAGKDDETIRLLDLEKGDIRVASYWTKLLPRAALAKKLHQAVRHARAKLG
jgi:predicted nuclease of restriction endonuclease-like (RecB) superfamily